MLAPLVALVLMLHAPCARAQQNMPFAGNGQEPEEPTTVFVSSYVDRLSHINDKEYEFEVGSREVEKCVASVLVPQ